MCLLRSTCDCASQMLRYGCTRLEIGVQSVYEDVARDTNRYGCSVHVGGTRGGEAERPPVAVLSVGNSNRGHTVKAVCESFELAKDAGYKVVAHMMPDLPNVGLERDIEQFIVRRPTRAPKHHSRFANARANAGPEPCHPAQELFANPAFRPDGLKLYPTLVIRGTGAWVPRAARLSGRTIADHPAMLVPAAELSAPGLHELWRSGRYKNYPPEVLVDLVAKILALVPPWTRVYRVQRYERCGDAVDRL